MPLENYQIIKVLSNKQQFGRLYLAQSKETSETVVIKSVLKEDLKACERLVNEAKWSFDTKGLPKIIEIAEDDITFSFIKSYVDGEKLDVFYAKLRKKQIDSFLARFTAQLQELLQKMHALHIVHCDIKPGNILISGDFNSFDVHLIDFGLAINTEDVEERKMLFPLGYAAPELLLNRLELVNAQTDIFSVGILIWRLIVGKLPLAHPNPSIFTNLQLTHPLPEHSSIKKSLYEILAQLSNKHAFQLPPNKMEKEKVTDFLIQARDRRPEDLGRLIEYFEDCASRRFKFW